MAKPIGTLGTIPTITVGGRTFTDLDNLIRLEAQTGVSNTNATFRKAGSSSGYQVPSGKSFKVCAVKLDSAGSAFTNLGFQIIQTDNDVGFASGTAFTSPVYECGESTFFPYTIRDPASINYENSAPSDFMVAAGKYVSCVPSSGGIIINATVYGYEV